MPIKQICHLLIIHKQENADESDSISGGRGKTERAAGMHVGYGFDAKMNTTKGNTSERERERLSGSLSLKL